FGDLAVSRTRTGIRSGHDDGRSRVHDKTKSPAFRRGAPYSLTNPASGPDRASAAPGGWDSASRGRDPAAADPASGRHPVAAGRVSDPGSGSAGPGCSDWSLGDLRCLTIAGVNGEASGIRCKGTPVPPRSLR